MLRYGFFDSEITGFDEQGMPVFDRAESSDFLAMFISHIISDGVLGQPGDCFQVIAGDGMTLKVKPGFAVIQGRFAVDWNAAAVTVPEAPASFKRIDRVVLRANYPERLCELVVKAGVPAASPVPPKLLQPESGDYYELCLATVAVAQNQSVITQANITDTRYDSSVCGVVTQVIDHLDTAVFFAQFDQFYREFVGRSDAAYERFTADMLTCLNTLQASGDTKLLELSEQFWAWFNTVKGQVSGDMAVKLQTQLQEHTGDSSIHVPFPPVQAGKVLKTDAAGNPAWQEDADTTYGPMKGATQSAAGTPGLVPAPPAGGQSGKYLRADGTWQTPPDTNTTYGNMQGSSQNAAGKAGLVPAPTAGAANRYLRNDGTWAVPPDNNTVYTHPTGAGSKHIPAGGSAGQILRWSADGTAAWGNDNNTTYSAATQSAAGLLSAADKRKLDGIGEGANKTTVDSALSATSTNPVQNKIVTEALQTMGYFKTSRAIGATVDIPGSGSKEVFNIVGNGLLLITEISKISGAPKFSEIIVDGNDYRPAKYLETIAANTFIIPTQCFIPFTKSVKVGVKADSTEVGVRMYVNAIVYLN